MTIKQLNEYCIKRNKFILVDNGKLKGFMSGGNNV